MGARRGWLAILLLGAWAGQASAQELAPILVGEPAPNGLLRIDPAALSEHFAKQQDEHYAALDEGKRRPKPPEQVFVVVDTPYEIWSGQGSYVRVVAYSDSFAPLPGAVVYLDELPVGLTDARGSLVFRNVPRGDDKDADHTITVLKRRAGGPQGVNAKTVNLIWPNNPAAGGVVFGQVAFESYQRTESFESTQLYAYTDRGVYNPGQTLHLRALSWRLRGDFEAIEGQEVEVRLSDPQGRLVGGEVLRTDAYGVVRWDLALPESAREGVYTLALQEGEDVAEARVRVERFVPPVIAIRHSLPRYASWDKGALAFEVRLSSFQGGEVLGGGLVFEARAGDALLCKQEQPHQPGQVHRFTLEGGCWEKIKQTTGDGGRFEARLVATDGVGRSDTLRREVLLTSQPYTVVLEKDKDEYEYGEAAKLLVKVVDVDEAPVPNHEVRLEVLEYPAADAPGDGDPRRRVLKGKTNGFGVALFDVKVKGEETCLDAFLKDVEPVQASECLYAVPARPIRSKVQVPIVKERAKVPIQVQIKPGYVPTEAVLHGDIVDSSGALVHAFDLPIQAGAGGYVAKGAFEAPSWGTMLLTMFVAAKHGPGKTARVRTGLLTEGQQITVEPNKALTLTLDGVPDEARPGQTLSVTARVLGPRGEPVDASVQAAVVDEAVLSLLDPMEVSPMQRLYNPELKVLSTTGSEILTWPVVSRNWGEAQLDIALPPFGFMGGDWEEPEDGDGYSYGYGLGTATSKGSKSGAAFGGAEVKGFGDVGGGLGESVPAKGKVSVKYPMSFMPSADPAPSADKPAALPKVEPKGDAEREGRRAQAPTSRLTLRTDLPETALWLDRATTQGGALRFEAKLPDAITQQRLTVLASDRKGGVGVTKKLIKVTQALVARADLPPVLLLGEEVEVRVAAHNLSPKPREVEVSLEGQGLDVLGPRAQRLKLAPGELLAAPFHVKATKLGPLTYEARAKGGGMEDAEQRQLLVRAGGVEVLDEERGVASPAKPFASSFEVQAGDEAFVTVAVPGVGPAARLLEQVDGEAWGFVEAPGTRAASAWQVLRLLQRQKLLTPERERRLRGAILEDLAWISAQQTPEGGYAYLRTGRASPWLTGRALEGLTAAREADLHVPDELLQGSARFILSHVNADGLVDTRDIAWWEGGAPERQLALSADLLRVLAEAGPRAIPPTHQDAFERLRARVARALKESSDPLTLGHAGLGLLAWEARFPSAKAGLDPKALARKLLDARKRGHWEPSWFNAAGGRWESTAAALELLQRLDPSSALLAQREAFLTLMAGRDLLGSWHNGAGTVMTLRALAALPPSPLRQDARLTVSLNGEPVAQALVKAEDPFASALPVARVELGARLKPGRNLVEVAWAGEGEPVVQRVRKRAVAPQPAPQGWQRTVRAAQAQLGGIFEVEQRLPAPDGAAQVLEERLPSLVEPDAASLDELRRAGTLEAWSWGDGQLRMVLSPTRKATSFVWRMEAARPGLSTLPPALLWTPAKGEAPLGVGAPANLAVQ